MAVINFENYIIKNMEYRENNEFDLSMDPSDIELKTEFSFEFNISEEDNRATIDAKLNIGNSKKNNVPFFVSTQIKAYFTYNVDEDENSIGFENYLKANALAIIFPYLRQTISNLTNMSNRFPAYIMPTINIMALINDSENTGN